MRIMTKRLRTVRPLAVERAMETVGQSLREARLLQRLSQEVVASRAGVSVSTVKAVENGGANPTLEAVLRVARALGYLDVIVGAFDYRATGPGRYLLGQVVPGRA